MAIATYILFLLGCLGATDIVLYHSISHGIRSHADSRQELIVHSLRGPTYAALFVVVPNFVLQGLFFWFLIALFAFDMAISIWDFAIERQSRQFFGGLPSGEYVLHIIIAMLDGSLVTAVCFAAGKWSDMPTGLHYEPPGVPTVLRIVMMLMAVLVLISGTQDALAALRLRHLPSGQVIEPAGPD